MNSLKLVNTIELESVIHRVLELLPRDSVTEDKLLEWAYQSFESLAPREAYEINTAILDVRNNVAELPTPMNGLEMVMYNTRYYNSANYFSNVFSTSNTTKECKVETDLNTGCTTETKITTIAETKNKVGVINDKGVYKSDGNVIIKEQLQYGYIFNDINWAPLEPSSSAYITGLLQGYDPQLYKNCTESFTIKNKCVITTFEEGLLAIAYYSFPKNNEGHYVIPDKEYVSAAIESHLKKKYWEWRMNLKEDGAAQMYRNYAQEYEILAAKATAALMMPELMEYQRLKNLERFFPNFDPYSIGLGNSNKKEKLYFNNSYRQGIWH